VPTTPTSRGCSWTGLRSLPVLEHRRLAGIVARRDLLAALVRPDPDIRHDLLRLVESEAMTTQGTAAPARGMESPA
jgi:CBS domain-containing protein